jgi:acetyl-CoA carboxylase biotin carboxyl carrier protein
MEIERIKDLIALMKESGVTELSVEQPDYKVSIKRGEVGEEAEPEPASAEAAPALEEPPAETDLVTVSAPMVGVFRLGGAGEGAAYLAVGDRVERGQAVAAIESMKVPNDVPAPAGGRIEEILVADGTPVEFGQALMRIRPAQEESP